MKLVLHLGFHKTASTHLQGILESVVPEYDGIRYVGPLEFRAKTVWFKARYKGLDQKRSEAYLKELSSSSGTVVISDENICGHSDDIFRHSRFYEHLFGRLQSLSAFSDRFDTTDVWVAIRNPATFIPSIYCEAMRWKGYQSFSEVFQGDFNQSWLPVIRDILDALPNSNINVICYENYRASIPQFFDDLGVDTGLFNDKESDVVRRSPSWHSIKTYKNISYFLPLRLQKRLLQFIERFDGPDSEPFAPFSELEIKRHNTSYAQDIASIAVEKRVKLVEGNFG